MPGKSQDVNFLEVPDKGTMVRLATSVLVLVLAAAGCGKGEKTSGGINRDTLTERQKDSILAKSRIPGASAVGRAMTAADTMSARVRVSDTVQ